MIPSYCWLLVVVVLATANAQGFHGDVWEQKSLQGCFPPPSQPLAVLFCGSPPKQTKPEKQTLLWEAVGADKTPNEWPGVIQQAELFVEQMNLTFDSIGISPYP